MKRIFFSLAALATVVMNFGIATFAGQVVYAQEHVRLIAEADTGSSTNVLENACKVAPESTVCQESQKGFTSKDNQIFGPNGLFTKAASIISILVGVASVIMIIVGGFRYVMSSGDSNNIKGAKDTILYAIIGLGVALFAQAVIVFVIKKL